MNTTVERNKYLKDNTMAKKAKAKAKLETAVKKTAKRVVKKVLDSTELDEKIVAEYKEHKSTYDMVLCYVKCYGGYVVAVGAGCSFGVSGLVGLGLLIISGIWGWKVNCPCKPCKGGAGTCCKQ